MDNRPLAGSFEAGGLGASLAGDGPAFGTSMPDPACTCVACRLELPSMEFNSEEVGGL